MALTAWLDAAQKRCDEAADGLWEAVDDFASAGDYMVRQRYVRPDEPDSIACEIGHEPTAEFIAHARTDLPAALAALRAVLEAHMPYGCCNDASCQRVVCADCECAYPCPTVRAIATALGTTP